MAFPFLTISSNIDSLNSGSFYSENDLSVFNISQSSDVFFGNSSQDVIEFSVYNIAGNLSNWNILEKNDTYNIINGTYKDVDNNNLSYSYKKYNGSYIISTNRKILLNTKQDLINSGIQSGSQVVSYNFLRNVAGNTNYKLIIKSISTDRKEIQLIPNFKLDTNNEENLLQNLNFEGFSRKMILVNDIAEKIIIGLNGFNAEYYYKSIITDDIKNQLNVLFGFQTEAQIIQFLNDIYFGFSLKYIENNGNITLKKYDGIKTYVTNWIYTYYKNLVNISDLNSQFEYIITKSAENNLTLLNYNYQNIDSNGVTKAFIDSVFYTNFIVPLLNNIGTEYNNKYFSYLKNSLNFGNNQFYPIINHDFITDSNNNTILIVKLHDYLSQNINLRDTCWVSNISNVPIIQKVIFSTPKIKPSYKISGPNFNINPKIKNKPIIKKIDYKSKNQIVSNNQNQVEFNKKLKELNVDYSNFSNFVLFSSAQLRVKLFVNKLNQITSLSSSLVSIKNESYNTPEISASYSYDINSINNQLDNIFQSFDGYDAYLYNNQYLINESNYSNYLNSAIDYDYENRDSLVNNTPEYINSNTDEYSDYLVFLSMIGHFFDNIYLYINNFPTTQYLNNSNSNSFISSISDRLLEQFGWTPISSVENISMDNYYLINNSGSFSQKEKMQIIWNRILNNLPMIYKTKGTEESVRMLANIYGIPYSFLNIKEFGGNSVTDDDKSSYSFQKRYYLTNYSGSNEYISLPYNSNIKTIEFKFSFNTDVNYLDKTRIYLLSNDTNFKVYVDKTLEDFMGTLSFQLNDQILTTNPLPLFNGNIFNVLIQQQPYNDGNYSTQIPSLYYLKVNSVDNDNVVFQNVVEEILNDSYSSYFSNNSNLYFGNISGGNNNFYGTIDRINLWNTVLSNDAFIDHCKNFDAFDDYDSANTYINLYFRYKFDYPINLAESQSISIPNSNKVYSYNTGSAYNFPNTNVFYNTDNCTYYTGSKFPYQFKEIDLNQNVSLSNFGPNKLKNVKINKVNQSVEARLMPTELSTTQINVTNDSNLLAACISPFSVRDNDMLNFIGNYNIMDIVGNPSYLYSSNYIELDELRQNYNQFNSAEPVLYQEFFTIYKNYIDSSFFDSVKQLVPARSKLLTGTLIEQSILERNKYQNKPIESNIINELDSIEINAIKSIVATNYLLLNTNLTASIQKVSKTPNNILPTSYFSEDLINRRFSAASINGNCYEYVQGKGYLINYIYKIPNISYYYNYIPFSSNYSYLTSSNFIYNFTQNTSSFNEQNLDLQLYPVGHYALRKSTFGKTFTTGINNPLDRNYVLSGSLGGPCINSSGSIDNSSPIEVTAVNQNLSVKKLVSI
jgi:hypothetical protein